MTAGDGSASSSVLSSGDGMVGGAVVNAATTAGDGPMASTIVPGDPMQFGGALTSSEPRDIAPVWVGDGSASGDAALISSEPRDFAPTDLSDGQALSSVIPSDSATSFNSDQLSQGVAFVRFVLGQHLLDELITDVLLAEFLHQALERPAHGGFVGFFADVHDGRQHSQEHAGMVAVPGECRNQHDELVAEGEGKMLVHLKQAPERSPR